MKTLQGERVGRSDWGLDQVGVEREGGGEGVVGVEGGRDGGQGLGVTRCGSNYNRDGGGVTQRGPGPPTRATAIAGRLKLGQLERTGRRLVICQEILKVLLRDREIRASYRCN